MISQTTMLISIMTTLFASSGFWAFVTTIMNKRYEKSSAQAQMLKGLGHDRICFLGEKYIERGYISKDEYENLNDYLFLPYEQLGGNGTAKKIMNEVRKLPSVPQKKEKE